MSLRDELLKVGLINKKQAEDAERKRQRQERPPPRHGARPAKPPRESQVEQRRAEARPSAPPLVAPQPQAAPRVDPSHRAAAAKVARDMELNRKIQERADKKARSAQVAQMIKQNRLAPVEGDESYNFVDGTKIRRIPVNAELRAGLMRGAVLIVRHDAQYDLIPAALAERLRERDPNVFITSGVAPETSVIDDSYAAFPVPDDLQW